MDKVNNPYTYSKMMAEDLETRLNESSNMREVCDKFKEENDRLKRELDAEKKEVREITRDLLEINNELAKQKAISHGLEFNMKEAMNYIDAFHAPCKGVDGLKEKLVVLFDVVRRKDAKIEELGKELMAEKELIKSIREDSRAWEECNIENYEQSEYYRLKLRRLEDRIRNKSKQLKKQLDKEGAMVLDIILYEYKEAERKREK